MKRIFLPSQTPCEPTGCTIHGLGTQINTSIYTPTNTAYAAWSQKMRRYRYTVHVPISYTLCVYPEVPHTNYQQ